MKSLRLLWIITVFIFGLFLFAGALLFHFFGDVYRPDVNLTLGTFRLSQEIITGFLLMLVTFVFRKRPGVRIVLLTAILLCYFGITIVYGLVFYPGWLWSFGLFNNLITIVVISIVTALLYRNSTD